MMLIFLIAITSILCLVISTASLVISLGAKQEDANNVDEVLYLLESNRQFVNSVCDLLERKGDAE